MAWENVTCTVIQPKKADIYKKIIERDFYFLTLILHFVIYIYVFNYYYELCTINFIVTIYIYIYYINLYLHGQFFVRQSLNIFFYLHKLYFTVLK